MRVYIHIYIQVFIVSHIPHNVLAIFHDFILLIDVGACRNQKPGLLKRENGKRPCRIGADVAACHDPRELQPEVLP